MTYKTKETATYSVRNSHNGKAEIMEHVSNMFDICEDGTGSGMISVTFCSVDENGARDLVVKAYYND